MWSTRSICQTRPAGPFPFSMCCWRMSQEGFLLRIRAMTSSLALLGNAAVLVKRRITEPARCVRQDASSRLPIFLCVEKGTQALQFLWVLDGIQFRDSSTCFFFALHLTSAIKARKWTSNCCENRSWNYSPLQKTAIAHSKWQQPGAWSYLHVFSVWSAYFRIPGYIFLSNNSKGGGLHPPPERHREALIDVPEQHRWVQQHNITSGFLRANCRSQDTHGNSA